MDRDRVLIGFAGTIGFVAFIIVFIVSLFSEATWTERLLLGAVPAAITFVAAILLASREPMRRQYQFSVRTLLVLVTAICVGLAR